MSMWAVESPPVASTVLRCSDCNKLLAELVTAPYRVVCPRCKTINEHH